MRILFSILISLFVIASINSAQSIKKINPSAEHKYYYRTFSSQKVIRTVSVSNAKNELLATIQVPVGVVLSVYADKESKKPTGTEYSGFVSIRTKLLEDIPNGSSDAMSNAPFRLDLAEAIVFVHKSSGNQK